MPERVYLHAGTKEGAKALSLHPKGKALAMDALPEAFRVLEPWEAEDVLCLFKADF